jgi:hypothetical protein
MEVSGHRHAPHTLYCWGKHTKQSLSTRLGGPLSRFEKGKDEKHFLPLPKLNPSSVAQNIVILLQSTW